MYYINRGRNLLRPAHFRDRGAAGRRRKGEPRPRAGRREIRQGERSDRNQAG